MAKSLPPISAKVIADAEQYINELKRAEARSRTFTTEAEKQFGDLKKKLGRTFSTGDIGKSILSGIGLGSGFAIAEKASEKISDYWRLAAEQAKATEEHTARMLELVKQGISARQTPDQMLTSAQADFDRLTRERAALLNKKVKHRDAYFGDYFIPHVYDSESPAPRTKDEQEKLEKITEELQKAGNRVDQLKRKLEETFKGKWMFSGTLNDITASEGRLLKMLEQVRDVSSQPGVDGLFKSSALGEDVAVLEKASGSLKEISNVFKSDSISQKTEQWMKAASQAGETLIKAKDAQLISEDQFNRNMSAAEARAEAAIAAREAAAKDLKEETKETAKLAEELGWSFSSAFEDAIVRGEKFSQVLRGLAEDIARIAIRKSITEPIGNWFSSFFSGMFKAAGGPVEAGRSYIVGEQGQEVFTPSRAGSIVANGQLAAAGGGGGTYYIDARGADRAGLARLEAMIRSVHGSVEQRAVSAVLNHRRRGVGA